MKALKSNIDSAMGRIKSELVLKNAFIINVYTQSIEKNDIAVNNGIITGIGKYDGVEELDCTGLFAAPGFIDSHVHIESSMVTPEVFSHLALSKGVTTVIADPHEIANVMGMKGIEYMLQNSDKSVMDIFYMLPSCVPATDFEDNGAKLGAEELSIFINDKRILGLGEVMDVPSVINGREEMLMKLAKFNGKHIDGHCPSVSEKGLNAYLTAGIKTDHECSTYEEALRKVQRGMYVLMREGSAARNLRDLLPAVNRENYHRFLFCTDDRHIEDLVEEGSIDNSIRLSIDEGLEPVKAYTMASLNSAVCFGLRDRGAISPGLKADIVVFKDLNKLEILKVIKDGKVYNNLITFSDSAAFPSMNIDKISLEDLRIPAKGKVVNVIKTVPHSLETKLERKSVIVENGYVSKVEGEDVLKLAVFERHRNTGKKSIGFIEGLGLKNCTVALSIAHDSHNIIAAGDCDEDMLVAVNSLIEIGGGIVLVSQGRILDYIGLPIGGLITSEDPHEVNNKIKQLKMLARHYGVKENFDPFLTLGFMALPVIPTVKLTARGLFNYEKFDFIDLFEEID